MPPAFAHPQLPMLRFNARLAVRGGGSQRVRDSFDRSIAMFGQLGYPFCLAVVLLEYRASHPAAAGCNVRAIRTSARLIMLGDGLASSSAATKSSPGMRSSSQAVAATTVAERGE